MLSISRTFWASILLILTILAFSIPVESVMTSEEYFRILEDYYKKIPPATKIMPDTKEGIKQWYEGARIAEMESKNLEHLTE